MTVIVGYVPTATGLSALRESEREALARNSDVLVVNVIGPRGYTVPTAADDRDLDAVLAHLAAAGIACTLRQLTDETSPGNLILSVAREVDAALIVLGLHQRSWLGKRVLGSTARAIVLAATCPVLIVPDADLHQPGSSFGGEVVLRSGGMT